MIGWIKDLLTTKGAARLTMYLANLFVAMGLERTVAEQYGQAIAAGGVAVVLAGVEYLSYRLRERKLKLEAPSHVDSPN